MSPSQLVRTFSTWPGDWVYHLIVLFSIAAMAGLARLRASGFHSRLLLTAIALAVGRGLLIVGAFITRQAGLMSTAVLPLLERCVDVAGLGWLVWAFIPPFGQWRWGGYILGAVNTAPAMVMCALFAPQWHASSTLGLAFNGSVHDIFWTVWGAILATLALAGGGASLPAGTRRTSEPAPPVGYALAAFAFILGGYLLHLAWPDVQLSTSGWTRLAFLVAFPLFGVCSFQATLMGAIARETWPQAEPSVNRAVWEALCLVTESADADSRTRALQQVATAIAQAMGVKAVAIGAPGDSPDVVELVAIHCSGRTQAAGGAFQLDARPALKRAITRRQGIPLTSPDEAVALAGLVGDISAGPIWVEPLVHLRQTLGVLIVIKDRNKPDWSPAEIQTIHAHAVELSRALSTSIRLESALDQAQTLSNKLSDIERRLAQSKAESEAQVGALRAEFERATIELGAARQQITQYRKQIDDLAALVQLQDTIVQRAQSHEASPEGWVPIQRFSDLMLERNELENRATRWQLEAARLVALQAPLEEQLKKAQQQIAALQEQLEAAARLPGSVAFIQRLKERQGLIADVAQELDALAGSIEQTLREPCPEALHRAQTIIAQWREMLAGLPIISRIEPLLEQDTVNLAEIVQQAVLAASTRLDRRGVTYKLDVAADLPPIRADRISLYRAVSLLLANAALCSRPNSEIVVLVRRIPGAPDYVQLSVRDSSEGIAVQDRPRLFSYSRRLESPIEGLGDTGAGLFTARIIVEAHGGRIWLDSEMGVGSTWTILLPTWQEQERGGQL